MKIAYLQSEKTEDANGLLRDLALRLLNEGHEIVACVQTNVLEDGKAHAEMDVEVLPKGSYIRISQNLGEGSTGCRLDPNALETAVGEVEARMSDKTKLLVLNKFGKQEAEGRGFRQIIGEALSQDIPVILCVNEMNLGALKEFGGDFLEPAANEDEALMCWAGQYLG